MDYDGDLSLLHCLAQGNKRIGALGLSGGTAGAEGCAQACAFESRGLTKFTVLCGVSSFAGPLLYLANGNLNEGASCFWEECSTNRFIDTSLKRLWNGTTADVGFLAEEVFRKETSVDTIRSYPGDLMVTLTDWESGQGELVNVKTAFPDVYAPVQATMAMPVLYRRPVIVNGRRKYDGAVGMPFPARELVEGWDLDGLIIFANRPRRGRDTLLRRSAEAATTLGMTPLRRRALLDRHTKFRDGQRSLEQHPIRKLILWTSGKLDTFTRDAATIQAAAENAQREMFELLHDAGI